MEQMVINLCGEVKEGSNEEVEEKPVGQLLSEILGFILSFCQETYLIFSGIFAICQK